MASRSLRLGRLSRPFGILIAAEVFLSLPGITAMAMTLTSPAFRQNGQIPSKYTCGAAHPLRCSLGAPTVKAGL
jgi:phosphatidylethanolamine-binding protein (PEBP) family uncharacterized protein